MKKNVTVVVFVFPVARKEHSRLLKSPAYGGSLLLWSGAFGQGGLKEKWEENSLRNHKDRDKGRSIIPRNE
jgi:hypothetical protein